MASQLMFAGLASLLAALLWLGARLRALVCGRGRLVRLRVRVRRQKTGVAVFRLKCLLKLIARLLPVDAQQPPLPEVRVGKGGP